jgi:site-specific DNA-adenine methylase
MTSPITISADGLTSGLLERRAADPRRSVLQPVDPIARSLRPFFGYYGGKWRDAVKHYPRPAHRTIVEPFAGSAGYAIRYPSCNVILCEVDPILAGVWQFLIRVRRREILSIPDLPANGSIDDLKVPQEAKWLIGFWLNRGVATPRKSPSRWMRDDLRPGSFWGDRVRNTIASQVDAIRHWKVFHRSYEDCPSPRAATWFVDPPYQRAGKHYRFGSDNIDYKELAYWCRSRPGLVIVCENAGADWLPFTHLADVKTTRAKRRSKEVVWTNEVDRVARFTAQGRPRSSK